MGTGFHRSPALDDCNDNCKPGSIGSVMNKRKLDLIQSRTERAYDAISRGDCGEAVSVARELLSEYGSSFAVRYNCAGFMIDAGERLDDEQMVLEGTAILESLYANESIRRKLGERLIYSLANGRSAPAHMRSRRRPSPDFQVRDLSVEERAISLYYAATNRLRNGSLEAAINCASTLRLEGRYYAAIDILDGVLHRDRDHPNANQKMAEILWAAYMACRGRDFMPKALLVAALWHYEKAEPIFSARNEPMQVASNQSASARLRELIGGVLHEDPDELLSEIGRCAVLGTGGRVGSPLGLSLLSRSPYVDGDDPHLIGRLPPEVRELFADVVGTYAAGRYFMSLDPLTIGMAEWRGSAPLVADHMIYASVRQFWSVLDKLAWILNQHFEIDLEDDQCHFAVVFRPPSKEVRAKRGLSVDKGQVVRHPNLERENPGLLALSGLSFSIGSSGVYAPIKRLRHAVEHRVPDAPATHDDAAFMLAVVRAAILHTVDAIVWDLANRPGSHCDPTQKTMG